MANADIGYVKCVECDCSKCAVRESTKGKHFAYKICPECGDQSFCRSALCDQNLRKRMKPVGEAGDPKPENKESKDESWFP